MAFGALLTFVTLANLLPKGCGMVRLKILVRVVKRLFRVPLLWLRVSTGD